MSKLFFCILYLVISEFIYAAEQFHINVSAGLSADNIHDTSFSVKTILDFPYGKLSGVFTTPLTKPTANGNISLSINPFPWCTLKTGSLSLSGILQRLINPKITSSLHPVSARSVTRAIPEIKNRTSQLRPIGAAIFLKPQLFLRKVLLSPFITLYGDENTMFASSAGIEYTADKISGSTSVALSTYLLEQTDFTNWFSPSDTPLPVYLPRTRYFNAALETEITGKYAGIYFGTGAVPSLFGGFIPWFRNETFFSSRYLHISSAIFWVPHTFITSDGTTISKRLEISCTPLIQIPFNQWDTIFKTGAALFINISSHTGKFLTGCDISTKHIHIRCTAGWTNWQFPFKPDSVTSIPIKASADFSFFSFYYTVSSAAELFLAGPLHTQQKYTFSAGFRPIGTESIPLYIPQTRLSTNISCRDGNMYSWDLSGRCSWKIHNRYTTIRVYVEYTYKYTS